MHNIFTYCSFDLDGAALQFNVERALTGEAFSRHLSEVNDKMLWV